MHTFRNIYKNSPSELYPALPALAQLLNIQKYVKFNLVSCQVFSALDAYKL